MLAVARALIAKPRLLMLDEASAGLSPKMLAQVFAKLAEIRATGITILLVEQNARAALALADRAYHPRRGAHRARRNGGGHRARPVDRPALSREPSQLEGAA